MKGESATTLCKMNTYSLFLFNLLDLPRRREALVNEVFNRLWLYSLYMHCIHRVKQAFSHKSSHVAHLGARPGLQLQSCALCFLRASCFTPWPFQVTVCGKELAWAQKGQRCKFNGRWQLSKYGAQVQVDSFETMAPETSEGVCGQGMRYCVLFI